MLDILDLIEEADMGSLIVSTSPQDVADECCCVLTVSGLLIRSKVATCRAGA